MRWKKRQTERAKETEMEQHKKERSIQKVNDGQREMERERMSERWK